MRLLSVISRTFIGGGYPSAVVQLVYSTASADWEITHESLYAIKQRNHTTSRCFLGFSDRNDWLGVFGVVGAEKYVDLQEKSDVIDHCRDCVSPWSCPENYLFSCLPYKKGNVLIMEPISVSTWYDRSKAILFPF